MSKLKTVAVLQSNYIPWKGYFDIINDVDEFCFYDEVQYTKNDWRNRNKIIVNGKEIWLTIPVGGDLKRRICDVKLPDSKWQEKHYKTLWMAYHKARYWAVYQDIFEKIYLGRQWDYLSELNQHIIKEISYGILHTGTKFSDSRDYNKNGRKKERLLTLLERMEAKRYVSGPAAKAYINDSDFLERGIDIVWKDYTGYPEYNQRCKSFHNNVSILDLLFNEGENAAEYIWGWREEKYVY